MAGRSNTCQVRQDLCLNLLSVGLVSCNRTYPLTVLLNYPTGEDPILGGQLGVPLVKGIQKHVMAIAKHCKCAEGCSLSMLLLTQLAVTHRTCRYPQQPRNRPEWWQHDRRREDYHGALCAAV